MPAFMTEEPQSAPDLPLISGPAKCTATIQIELISNVSPAFAVAMAQHAIDLANRTLREMLKHLPCCVISPAVEQVQDEGGMPDLHGRALPIFTNLGTGLTLVPATAEEFAEAQASAEAGVAMAEREKATVQ